MNYKIWDSDEMGGGLIIRYRNNLGYTINHFQFTFSDSSTSTFTVEPTVEPGQIIEFKLPLSELAGSSYVAAAVGIELELEVNQEGIFYHYYYNPQPTTIKLNNDVLDISGGGWYCININF